MIRALSPSSTSRPNQGDLRETVYDESELDESPHDDDDASESERGAKRVRTS